MAKVTVDGNILAIQLSPSTLIAGHRMHWRIPLALVRSASVEAQPYQMLSEIDTLPELPHAPPGSPADPHTYEMNIARIPIFNITGGFLVGMFGPDGSKMFVHVRDGRPALRVDFTSGTVVSEEGVGGRRFFSGFLVTVHDPESVANEIRAAVGVSSDGEDFTFSRQGENWAYSNAHLSWLDKNKCYFCSSSKGVKYYIKSKEVSQYAAYRRSLRFGIAASAREKLHLDVGRSTDILVECLACGAQWPMHGQKSLFKIQFKEVQ